MPNFVRCSSEFGRWVQTMSAETNEPMTVILDRIMARYKELEVRVKELEDVGNINRKPVESRANGGSESRSKQAGKSSGKSGKASRGSGKKQEWVAGVEGLLPDPD